MEKPRSKSKKKKRKIVFSLDAPDAREVHLVGEFNDWKPGAHPMQKDANGIWIKPVLLPQGKFEYKFLVDEKWVADPQNERSCPNCYGTLNSVVNVVIF